MSAIGFSDIVQFLICAGIVWIGKTCVDNSKALVRLETILTGANGSNGLASEVKQLRGRMHAIENGEQASRGRDEVLSILGEQLRQGQQERTA